MVVVFGKYNLPFVNWTICPIISFISEFCDDIILSFLYKNNFFVF